MADGKRYGVLWRTVAVLLFLVPFLMGLAGTGIHFIPEPDLRWKVFVVAIAYSLTLAFLMWKMAKVRPPDEKERVPRPLKLALALFMATYFNYVAFFMTVPALITQQMGSPSERQFAIESIKRGGARATLCPYELHFREVSTVLVDRFCVSKAFADSHEPGETILLIGKHSRLGFRFQNVD